MKIFEKAKLTRRNFLKTGSAAAALSALGCGNKLKTVTEIPAPVEEGEWLSAACWHNCGGRCVNKALVSDGVVIRQKTDDNHADSLEYPQQRGCLKGRSQRKQVFAADRLKYPMVRKNWKPGGGDKTLRGRDEWVRVSWDEALNLIVSELKRIKDKFSNRSILMDDTYYTDYKRVMCKFGGYVDTWSSTSWGNWMLTPRLCGYGEASAWNTINDRTDIANCETIVFIGCNPAWSSAGMPSNIYKNAKNLGTKFIGVDPVFNETYAMLDAEWIPVRPVTDIALLLGVAHTLITEDNPRTNPLIDWEFLRKTSLGFDADSMPAGEDKTRNFKDYVLGTYDKQPKDAKWASEICGASPEQIKKLAYEIGCTKRVGIMASWALGRSNNTDSLPQIVMTIGAMTGHMGKAGHMTGMAVYNIAANNGPTLVRGGGTGIASFPNPVDDMLNEPEHYSAIMGKPYHWAGAPYVGNVQPCQMRTLDVRFIMTGTRARMQSRIGLMAGIKALRESNVECIVAPAQYLTNNAKYADIVLPLNTLWERDGGLLTGNRDILIAYTKISESLYESKSDYWIASELAKRLGFNDIFTISEKQIFFNQLAGSTVVNAAGDGYEPLCAITEKDIQKWGVDGKAQAGRIPMEEFIKQGVYQVPRKAGDPYGFIAFKDFRDDPVKNPSKWSKSGKFEIYCKELAEKVNSIGYSEIDPLPKYIAPLNGYEDTYSDWNKKVKGKFPYQVIQMHYMRRSHTVFDNVKQLCEAFKNPVYINSVDAKREGIATGNTVIIESIAGKSLRTALVTERLMPGCIILPHGSWSDIDENTGIDYGGSDNVLLPAVTQGQGTSGYNSLIVSIRKYSDHPLTPDADKPLRMVNYI